VQSCRHAAAERQTQRQTDRQTDTHTDVRDHNTFGVVFDSREI